MAIVTRIPINELSHMVALQIPFTALVVPVVLVGLFDGWRGVKQTWPVLLIVSIVFAVTQVHGRETPASLLEIPTGV